MTCNGMEIARRTAPISPALGVTPPSNRALHNSTRFPPPRSAATADSTESMQTSTRTLRFMPDPSISLAGSSRLMLAQPHYRDAQAHQHQAEPSLLADAFVEKSGRADRSREIAQRGYG